MLAKCSATRPGQSWDFTGDALKPYGTSLAVTVVASSGRLVLTVRTYGPEHELSAPGPSGQEMLAYCGTGRYPVLDAPCGTIWYVFTKIG